MSQAKPDLAQLSRGILFHLDEDDEYMPEPTSDEIRELEPHSCFGLVLVCGVHLSTLLELCEQYSDRICIVDHLSVHHVFLKFTLHGPPMTVCKMGAEEKEPHLYRFASVVHWRAMSEKIAWLQKKLNEIVLDENIALYFVLGVVPLELLHISTV